MKEGPHSAQSLPINLFNSAGRRSNEGHRFRAQSHHMPSQQVSRPAHSPTHTGILRQWREKSHSVNELDKKIQRNALTPGVKGVSALYREGQNEFKLRSQRDL